MNPELIFHAGNSAALLAWVVLACAPLRREPILFAARAMSAALAVVYLVLFTGLLTGGEPPDFSTLADIAAGFAQPSHALVGWIHYLAFDLWVGAWEVEDAARRRVPHWAVLPCLALTFMVGPVGLLAYLAVRSVVTRVRPVAVAA